MARFSYHYRNIYDIIKYLEDMENNNKEKYDQNIKSDNNSDLLDELLNDIKIKNEKPKDNKKLLSKL